jgi:hypothetical protein
MKILKILSSAMFCAAGLAALGAQANAAVIPVADRISTSFPPVFLRRTISRLAAAPAVRSRTGPLSAGIHL